MNKKKQLVLLCLVPLLLTGCTRTLKDKDNKVVVNEVTGQNLTENILCRPTDTETIKLYGENDVDIESLPYCVCKTDKVEKTETVTNEETVKVSALLRGDMMVFGQVSL